MKGVVMDNYDILDLIKDAEPHDQVIEINEIMNEASMREKERIIKLLENKLNSIPWKIGEGRTDKTVIRRTIKEIISILKEELDGEYYEAAS